MYKVGETIYYSLVAIFIVALILSLWWARHGFDRAMSKDMDNTVGDLRKRSKIVTANAANDEVFALAA
jgi:hypothetical protein